ncbi:MAG: hypothetical protein ISP80_06765 [Synechococcus sp. BS301-5m-G53]|nr:hypothetical protein [Synechococcus sp. BS301-5m-G53]
MTQAIVTIKAGISQTGLENEKRLNIIQPSARGRKFHHFLWSMPIRSGNPCRGGAGVPQTTKQPNPTIQLQPRIAIHVATPENSPLHNTNRNSGMRHKETYVLRNTRDKECHDI